jgi:putative thioredoxin
MDIATATSADTFTTDVIEASHRKPVVVDFWAPWCGPCHQLSPILERVAAQHADEVAFVKLDVDQAPAISQRYGIQGIPAVKAFRDGRVIAEFTGVQPEAKVAAFFSALLPSQADQLVRAAGAVDSDEERERLLAQAVELDRGHRDAVLGLAAVHAERGEHDEARSLLARLPVDDEVRTLLATLALAGADEGADLEALREAADGGDTASALQLGTVLAARGEHAEAVEHLLVAVADPEHREAAREALLAIFAVAGEESDVVRAARPRLAKALF